MRHSFCWGNIWDTNHSKLLNC